MNILLIGGTGVLSSAITIEALKRDISVSMINRGISSKTVPDKVELIISDHKNYDYIREILKGRHFDAVVDFLCYSDKDTTDSFQLYKEFTNQYFFISSCAVYDTRTGQICYEDSPKVLPDWKYSVDKWASEQQLTQMAEGTGVNITIVRPCVTYGNTRIPYGISPMYRYHWTLAARILTGKPIIRWNGGINRCNMTRVEDFAVGVVGLIGNPKAYNEAFNVCGEETPSFNDVLDAMGEYLGKKPVIFDLTSEEYASEMPHRRGEILEGRSIDAIINNDKIKNTVPEFRQTINLKEGVRMTLDAYKAQNYQCGIDWKFDAETDRIIATFNRKKDTNISQYKIGFIDYFSNATKRERINYWLEYHKGNPIVRLFKKSLVLGLTIVRKMKELNFARTNIIK